MKKVLYILIAFALATTFVFSDDYYLCLFNWGKVEFARIPGPGYHDELDIVYTIPIGPSWSPLTYDGNNWWIARNGLIYCFDHNGDHVRDFPEPGTGYVLGLGWDGGYLWVLQDEMVYQLDVNGNPGPHGSWNWSFRGSDGRDPYSVSPSSLTIKDNRVIIGDSEDSDFYAAGSVRVYDFDGNYYGYEYYQWGYYYSGCRALAYHDGVIWAFFSYYDSDVMYMEELYGIQDGNEYAVVWNADASGLTVADADFIGIASASLGKIKAYFAEMEK